MPGIRGEEKEDYIKFKEGKVIKSPKRSKKSITLCHTPHFLGPPDKSELKYSEPKLTGYNHPGYF